MILTVFISLVLFTIVIYLAYTILCWVAAKGGKTHIKSPFFPYVTLLVCVYNEETVIGKKIDNIAKISYPPDKLKILFVNDNSTDQTRAIILDNRSKIPFEVEIIDSGFPRGKTNALNYVFSRITTEITIETDADSILEQESIRELVQNFSDKNVGGANGIVKILSPKSSKQTAQHENLYRYFYNLWRSGESVIHSISISNGPIMAFRTSLVQDVRLKSMADDTELLFEIIRKGYRVVYDKAAIAYECTPPKFSERLRQKMRRCKGIFQVYLKNIDLRGKNRFGRVIYPFVLMEICVLPYFVVLSMALYIWLAVVNPVWLLPLLILIVPKANTVLLNIIYTQLLMALCPFHRSGAWRTMKSSREMLARYDVKEIQK